MDLFELMRTLSLGGKRYGMIIFDDYSRFTWVFFLALKSEYFKCLACSAQEYIRSKAFISLASKYHEIEFGNGEFKVFCDFNDIHHNFS